MKRFTLAKLRFSPGQALVAIMLLCGLATLPGCVSSTLESIQIIPNAGAILIPGASVQFQAIAVYTHGRHPATTEDITDQVKWTSSLVEVATINATGLATAVAPGIATITATGTGNLGVVTQTTSVTVNSNTTPPTRDLVSISLVPATQTVTVGQSAQFVAVGTYTSAPLTQDITATWTSSVPTVATVNGSGSATGIAAGTATIFASAPNAEGVAVTGTAIVTVTPAPVLTSLAIVPASQTIPVGANANFIVIGSYSGTSVTADLTNSAVWTSSTPAVASITTRLPSGNGVATGLTVGNSTITASVTSSSGTIVTTAALTVTAGAPSPTRDLVSLTITSSSSTIPSIGGTTQLVATGNYSAVPFTEDLTATVTWVSNEQAFATVNNDGLVTAVSSGVSVITATATPATGPAIVAPYTVTVTGTTPPLARELTSITIIPGSQTIANIGGTAQFRAIGTYSSTPLSQDLTDSATWSSTQTSVATVTTQLGPGLNGVATGVAVGSSTITATAQSASGATITSTAAVTVTATAPSGLVSIAIVPSSQTVANAKEAAQFIAIGTYTGTNAATQDITSQVSWISSDVSVATINSDGLTTGNGLGTTAITATLPNSSGALIYGTATFTESGGDTAPGDVATLNAYTAGNGAGSITATYIDPENDPPTTILGPCTTGGSSALCLGVVPVNTTVTVTATPSGTSTFGGWSANCTPLVSAPATCQMTISNVTGNQTVVAIFNP